MPPAETLGEAAATGLRQDPLRVHASGDTPITWAPPETSYRVFAPRRLGVYAERFGALARAIGAETELDRALAALEAEHHWATAQQGAPQARDRFRAALSVMADLLAQGWSWRHRNHQIELAPPDFTSPPRDPRDVARQKDAIRASMSAERVAQMLVPSARRFLEEMERPRCHDGRSLSILSLVASGEELARQLRSLASLEGNRRAEALDRVVRPYLQLVEGDELCEHTGYRRIDIWRYFRYSWSLPYFSTPGRNLFYLVRDEARPLHPVIGIAALGNSIVRLADRERWIGWTVEWVEATARNASGDSVAAKVRLARSLYAAIEHGISEVDPTGLATVREIANPTERVLRKLLDRARTSAHRRVANLRAHAQDLGAARRLPRRSRALGGHSKQDMTLADESVEDLYAQKRATELAELLRAKRTFLAAEIAADPAGVLDRLLGNEEGRRAIGAAIKTTKKQHIGTSMMDVIICGAIPPYNHVLGGKLVCMLLTSPQVRLDYRRRYAKYPSEIASKMKGEIVSKPADLVFLGTTSLYHVGSSQYNRVKIPAEIAGGEGEVRYERLGATRGYGSVHFSDRTRTLLERVVHEEKGAALITHTFGEGVSPKLRLVREGLASIGVDQDSFLQHQCRRIIYGVALARNAREYLRGEVTAPDFTLRAETPKQAIGCTRAIAEYWARRWLLSRIENPDALERVARSAAGELKMSAVADRAAGAVEAQGVEGAPHGPGNADGDGPLRPPPPAGPLGVAFIQQLYNHRSCYADRLTAEQLDAIHVETPLESFVIEMLRAGKDVVLTGNPGDGKTHLIKRLLPTLNALGAEHHADATAEESYEAILEAWQRARKRKKPFCLAINEWPLLELVRDFADKFPLLAEIRGQIEHGVIYDDASAPTAERVIVIDLNNRNLVDRLTFNKLLATLTHDRFYPECPACPARETCDVPKARGVLSAERVRDRLFALLELVTKRGHHVTMRDLQGFIAFLLTGGRSCTALIAAQEPSPYYTLAFEGESDLFDALRDAFDPSRVTHPTYDEGLWTGTLSAEGWMNKGALAPPPVAAPGDQAAAMRAAKRHFFFEHVDGIRLLQLLPQDERRFFDALDSAAEQSERVVRDLVRLINRFFDARDDSEGALRLWSRHCYDARWSPTYVSVRAIPIAGFDLEVPRLSPVTTRAHAYQADHVLLAARLGERVVARLTADLSLYRTLFDAQRGLPMALRSAEVVKRLDLFFNQLGRAFPAKRDIEDVHIKNFETGEDLRFKVDRRNHRYSV